jgi:hypothetical protein
MHKALVELIGTFFPVANLAGGMLAALAFRLTSPGESSAGTGQI